MERLDLSPEDHKLVAAAAEAVRKPISQPLGGKAPALVGSAVRLEGGEILSAVNLIADVGGLSVCAEPIVIAEAVFQPEKKIEAIVAVYHAPGQAPCVISPCGRCREAITDYAPESHVILREPRSEKLFKVKALSLLPFKYAEYWHEGQLI